MRRCLWGRVPDQQRQLATTVLSASSKNGFFRLRPPRSRNAELIEAFIISSEKQNQKPTSSLLLPRLSHYPLPFFPLSRASSAVLPCVQISVLFATGCTAPINRLRQMALLYSGPAPISPAHLCNCLGLSRWGAHNRRNETDAHQVSRGVVVCYCSSSGGSAQNFAMDKPSGPALPHDC